MHPARTVVKHLNRWETSPKLTTEAEPGGLYEIVGSGGDGRVFLRSWNSWDNPVLGLYLDTGEPLVRGESFNDDQLRCVPVSYDVTLVLDKQEDACV